MKQHYFLLFVNLRIAVFKIQLLKNHDRILAWVSLWSTMDLFPIQLMIIIYLFYNMSFFVRSSCVSAYTLNFIKLTLIVIFDAFFNSQWHRKRRKSDSRTEEKKNFLQKNFRIFQRYEDQHKKNSWWQTSQFQGLNFIFFSYSYENSTVLFILLKS